jgi:hypothetical protein
MRTTPMKRTRVLLVLACIFVVVGLTSVGATARRQAASAQARAGEGSLGPTPALGVPRGSL